MALITSSTQNVDLIKLKSEIEAYLYGADNTKFLVRGSQTNSSGQLELDIIIAQTGSPNLTTNQIVVLSDLIINHQNNQRKRIIVSDAPDANDAAANKQFVQQQVNEAVSNLIGSAPTVLDTLGEIAEIMAKDPVTGVYPNSIAPSIISRLDTLENNPAITKLDDLSDVVIDSQILVDDQVLKYNSATNAWINASAGTTFNSDITVNGITVGKGNNSLTGNTALGAYALISVQGNPNTPFGPGDDNTAIGAYALSTNTTGQMNVAVGSGGTLGNNTTGSQNIAIGDATLIGNSTGNSNIAIGKNALMWNSASSYNVAIGQSALGFTTGQKNVAIGNEAGYAITTGSYNVVIGGNSGSSIATSDGNILISDGQGNIRIKSDGSGKIGINNLSPQAALHVNSEGYVGLIVKGSVSQTANLLEIQNSSGNIGSSISSTGSGTFNGLRCTAKSVFDTSSFGSPHGVTGTNTYNSKTYQHAFWGALNGPTMLVQCSGIHEALVCAQGSSTLFSVTDRGTTISETSFESYALSLVANNAHANPTNIAKFQQLGVDKVVISKEGNLTATGTGTFNAPSAVSKGLIIKGAVSQTANLFEAQNSSGTALFSIDKDGSVAAGAVPAARVSGLATVATSGSYDDLSNKPTSASGIPAGLIAPFAGQNAPAGWLLCDGSSVNTYTYRDLHFVISSLYGGDAYQDTVTNISSATSTFKVPDLRRRSPVGAGASDTLGHTESSNNVGLAYASRSLSHSHTISHTHTIETHRHTVPNHTHDIGSHTHTVSNHYHTLSDAGAAKFSLSSTDTFTTRVGTAAWTRNFSTSPDQGWATSSDTHNTGIGLIGTTDGNTAGTGDPSAGSVTAGVNGNPFGFLTNINEGGVSTNTQTGSNSGPETLPHLIVNYIIKT